MDTLHWVINQPSLSAAVSGQCDNIIVETFTKRLCRSQVFNTSVLGGAVRHASLEAGEGKTGHIETGPDKAIIYFDSESNTPIS
jgi:hypothetical protein